MKNPRQWASPRIVPLLLLWVGLFLMPGCASLKASYPDAGHSLSKVDESFASKVGKLHGAYDDLHRLKKEGQLHLTLHECLRMAMERNRDIHLVNSTRIAHD